MRADIFALTALPLLLGTGELPAQETSRVDSLTDPFASPIPTWFSIHRPAPLSIPWLEQSPSFEESLPFLFVPVTVSPFPLVTVSDPFLKPDLTAPLRLQRAGEESNRTLYQVLGTVQIGGVAYLAYRHIKKYGLLK